MLKARKKIFPWVAALPNQFYNLKPGSQPIASLLSPQLLNDQGVALHFLGATLLRCASSSRSPPPAPKLPFPLCLASGDEDMGDARPCATDGLQQHPWQTQKVCVASRHVPHVSPLKPHWLKVIAGLQLDKGLLAFTNSNTNVKDNLVSKVWK